MQTQDGVKRQLTRYLSPAGAWAFAVGTSIGWGSMVVTSNTYLAQAGPLGSVLGMVAGALIMLVISRCYAYMMNCYPEAGGAYTYCREAFGYDHAFLTAWFLALTYLAMLWANATSLPLFARYFLGRVFEVGRLYTVFDYDVYLGEALLSAAAVLLAAFLCSRFRKAISLAMIVMAVFFAAGILICFALGAGGTGLHAEPAMIPGKHAFSQIVKIAVISPWAFIGFESISHGAEEFSFRQEKIFRILVITIVTTTILYLSVILLSVTAYPRQYGSWLEYIRDLDNLEGIEALPAFYAANHYLGRAGVILLMLSLLMLIVTSLFGNMTALSRLFFAASRDGILPEKAGEINRYGVPGRAILIVALISMVVPFIGRIAIGWIVDVTTLGATLIYGFVSASAYRTAKFRNDKADQYAGLVGLVIMIAFGAYLLLPNLFTTGSMETESYFLFVVWAVLGFFFFRIILRHDEKKRFGKSIVVWIALLSLILFVSLVWMNQSVMTAAGKGLRYVESLYTESGAAAQEGVVASQLAAVRLVSARSLIVVVALFALSLGVLLTNYNLLSRQAQQSELALGQVRALASKDPLTGVKNKLAFSESERELDEKIHSGEAPAFALAVCDLNGLKLINDTKGHKAGDDYICRASRMICEAFLHSPVFRTGGDEFVVLLSGRDYEQREEIAAAFRQRSEEHIASEDVVISIGMAAYLPDRDTRVHTVFERADAMMYEEKKRLKSLGAATRL